MDKLAVFYALGSFGNPNWKEHFFQDQMNVLRDCSLYDNIQFIDIFFDSDPLEYIPIEEIPDKTNNLVYYRSKEEFKSTNSKKYNHLNSTQQKIWTFAHANPEYKILFFGSHGVTHYHNPEWYARKYKWRKYMEALVIRNWRQSIELLNYYDCVGTDLVEDAVYGNGAVHFRAPHYQGHFWWANAEYIKKLDPLYCYQDVGWQPWLCELWIGSGNPNFYSYYQSGLNQYLHDIDPPYADIVQSTENHLMRLRYV
jgi:hypothetical protein